MITDTWKQIAKYRGMHKNLDTAIAFLEKTDLRALPDGKTVIDGDQVFVNVMEADLCRAQGAAFEYHRRYADLQIDITGGEYWEAAFAAEAAGRFDETTDFGRAEGKPAVSGTLGDGRFVLFLPMEYHKPSCQTEVCSHVRKAVVKIRMDE